MSTKPTQPRQADETVVSYFRHQIQREGEDRLPSIEEEIKTGTLAEERTGYQDLYKRAVVDETADEMLDRADSVIQLRKMGALQNPSQMVGNFQLPDVKAIAKIVKERHAARDLGPFIARHNKKANPIWNKTIAKAEQRGDLFKDLPAGTLTIWTGVCKVHGPELEGVEFDDLKGHVSEQQKKNFTQQVAKGIQETPEWLAFYDPNSNSSNPLQVNIARHESGIKVHPTPNKNESTPTSREMLVAKSSTRSSRLE